jgi:hypothetical protein
MQLKVKVQVKGNSIPISNFLNGLQLDYDRMQQRAMDILEQKARASVFVETPTPEQMINAYIPLKGNVSRITEMDIPNRIGDVDEYPEDTLHKYQMMSEGIERYNENLRISREGTIPIHRAYELLDDPNNVNWKYINKGNPKHMQHDYIQLHLQGFWKADFDSGKKTNIGNNIILESGPATFTKGRDVMLFAFFSSIPDILNMMKRVLLRNMGIYNQ